VERRGRKRVRKITKNMERDRERIERRAKSW
jgi:hypothetical protein